jgi:hypothetical protein
VTAKPRDVRPWACGLRHFAAFTAAFAVPQHATQSIAHSSQASHPVAQPAHGVAQQLAFATVLILLIDTAAAGPAIASTTSSQHAPGQHAAPVAQQSAFASFALAFDAQHGDVSQLAAGSPSWLCPQPGSAVALTCPVRQPLHPLLLSLLLWIA